MLSLSTFMNSPFGSLLFDSGFPSGYFRGFTLDVDAILADPSLGGGWQMMSLGGMSLTTNEIPAGGYVRTSIRDVDRVTYNDVTISRQWAPGTSARITEWFTWASKNGACDVTITVEVPAAAESGLGGLAASAMAAVAVAAGINPADLPGKKFTVTFRDCFPKDWQAPQLQAGILQGSGTGVQQPNVFETLTFSFSGFKVEAFSGKAPLVDTSISEQEKVELCKLVILPSAASSLAKMNSWTVGQSGLSSLLGLGTLTNMVGNALTSWAAMYDSMEFYLPPASIKIHKRSSWYVKKSVKAKISGPPVYLGPVPMKMSFDFVMKPTGKSSFETGGLIGGLQSGGGLIGAGLGALGIGGDAFGFGKPRTIMDDVKKMIALCDTYSGGGTPPVVTLMWGKFFSPAMYITDLTIDLVKFSPDGTPIKAMGRMVMAAAPTSMSGTNPTSGGLLPQYTDTLTMGESLAHSAYRAYGSTAHWRDLAAANGIDDPLRVPMGSTIVVPAAEELPQRTEGGLLLNPAPVDDGDVGEAF